MALSEQLIDILLAPERDRLTVAEVCRRHGISRKTFYVYLTRYRTEGPAGLAPRSRRPKNSPARTAGEIEALVVQIRDAQPRWGAGAGSRAPWTRPAHRPPRGGIGRAHV